MIKGKTRTVTGLTTVAGATMEEIDAEELPRYIQEQALRLYKMEGQSNEVTAQYNVLLRALQRRSGDAERISTLEKKLNDAEKKIDGLKTSLEAAQKRFDEQEVIVDESRTGLRILNQLAAQQLENGKVNAAAPPEPVHSESQSAAQPHNPRLPSDSNFLFRLRPKSVAEESSRAQATATISPQFFQSTPSKDPSFADLGREIFNLSESRDFIDPPIDIPFENTDNTSAAVSNQESGEARSSAGILVTSVDAGGNSVSTHSPADSIQDEQVGHSDANPNKPLQSSLNSPSLEDVTGYQHEDAGMAGTDDESPLRFVEGQDGREGSADSRSGRSSFSGDRDSDSDDGGPGEAGAGVEHVHEGAVGGEGELDADSPMELETSESEGEGSGPEAPVSHPELLSPSFGLVTAEAHFGSLTRRTSSLRTTLRASDLSLDTSQ
jgi:hypothetical protein